MEALKSIIKIEVGFDEIITSLLVNERFCITVFSGVHFS